MSRRYLFEGLYSLLVGICFLGGLWLMKQHKDGPVDGLLLMLIGLVIVSVRAGMQLRTWLSSEAFRNRPRPGGPTT